MEDANNTRMLTALVECDARAGGMGGLESTQEAIPGAEVETDSPTVEGTRGE